MASEYGWMTRLEAEDARRQGFDTELKKVSDLDGSVYCEYLDECENKAAKRYEIGLATERDGIVIDLCKEHDNFETAAMMYGRRI